MRKLLAPTALIASAKAPLLWPSFLASLAPVPDLNLALPDDFAAVAAMRSRRWTEAQRSSVGPRTR